MSDFTVQLVDPKFGRIVLVEVDSDSAANAVTAAEAAPGVSGPNADVYSAGGVVDQELVLQVSGTDADNNDVTSPTALPVVPA